MKLTRIFLMLLLCAVKAEARSQMNIPLDAPAKIDVSCCFDNASLPGYAPIDVTINNHSGQARQWSFQFSSPGFAFGSGNTMESTFTVSVENNGTRTTSFMVPTIGPENGQMPFRVRVTGYGVEGMNQQMFGGASRSGKPFTPYVVISESLATSAWSDLAKRIDSEGGRDLLGSMVNPDDLPEDWRGLSGVSGMWLTGDELNRLSAAQRNAVLTWVHAGGWLMLCGAGAPPQDFRFPGFGEVRLLAAKLDMNGTREIINSELPSNDGLFGRIAKGKTQNLTEVRPNVPLLFSFMGIFAITVGPLNVFALARRRRERLFWTTPLISLCASGLLMGMIVAHDGVGGHGIRNAVVCLFPESRSEVVMQEQTSRAGMLLDSAFVTRDPICLRQLDNTTNGQTTKGRALENDGNSYGGEWFVSRAAQTQRIVAVVPTRAEITLLAPETNTGDAAPIIVSSFEQPLDNLFYTDSRFRLWQGKNVRTGEKQTLQLVPQGPSVIERSLPVELHPFFNTPGLFVATSSQGGQGADYVQTLASIHWTDEPVTYVGPVTTNP